MMFSDLYHIFLHRFALSDLERKMEEMFCTRDIMLKYFGHGITNILTKVKLWTSWNITFTVNLYRKWQQFSENAAFSYLVLLIQPFVSLDKDKFLPKKTILGPVHLLKPMTECNFHQCISSFPSWPISVLVKPPKVNHHFLQKPVLQIIWRRIIWENFAQVLCSVRFEM